MADPVRVDGLQASRSFAHNNLASHRRFLFCLRCKKCRRRITTPAVVGQLRQDAKPFDKPAHRPFKALADLSRELRPVRGFFKGNAMKKKLLDTAGRATIALAAKPRPKFPAPVVFDAPSVTRVCNASSKEAYKPPAWPSARVSAADGVKSRGWA